MPDFRRGSAGGERQGLSPCLFSFRTATQCQRERFHLPAFRRAVHHLPVAVDEHIMEAHLFSAFSGNSLPERTVLTRLTVHPETTVTSVISRHTVHRVLKRMPGGFVATGTEATDITVFNRGFGLLTGGIVGMQDATVPVGSPCRWQ